MTGTAADDAPPPAVHGIAARRRSAGIYGTIVASAVLAAGGGHLRTVPLAVAVLVTLLVYWAAEGYAELLGEHAHTGRLPSWSHVRASLAGIWPMVTASYVPLASLLVVRVLGADTNRVAHRRRLRRHDDPAQAVRHSLIRGGKSPIREEAARRDTGFHQL